MGLEHDADVIADWSNAELTLAEHQRSSQSYRNTYQRR